MAATQSQIDAFVSQYSGYAQQAASATGLDAQLILAQWGNEVSWGTDFAEKNNIGNVGVYGGGPNPSYGTIQQGVQAYINEINSPAMAKVKATAGQSIAVQAAALGASGYASGGYLAQGSTQPGSALLADVNTVASGGYGSDVSTTSNMTAADWAGLQQAGAAGGTSYLEAQATSATAANPTPTATPGSAGNANGIPSAAESTVIDGTTYTTPASDVAANSQSDLSSQTSALAQINASLASYGFSGGDVNTLTSWAWNEITNNVDPTQVSLDMQTPGSTAYPVFQKYFPGFVAANQQLNAQGLPAVSVSTYQQAQTSYQAIAQAAGLPAAFINSQDIGTLIGGNVSPSEFSSRVNNAVTLAYNSTPEQQAMFNQYFGSQYTNDASLDTGQIGTTGHGPLTAGQIAAIALDPTKAEPLIAQQIQAAQIGGASVSSGVGAIDAATASQLAQAGITTSAATSAFQNLAPLSALEAARPGEGGEAAEGVVSADQIATGQLLGSPSAQRQLQTAQEVAKAPMSGGGGFVSNSKGVAGAGSASSTGAGNT